MYRKIGVVGLGYVGLTLAASLARKGYQVFGVDAQPQVLESLREGRVHIFEPGIAEVLAEHIGRSLQVDSTLPPDVDVAVLCVSTPVDDQAYRPNLATWPPPPSRWHGGVDRRRWWWSAARCRSERAARWCCRRFSPAGAGPGW